MFRAIAVEIKNAVFKSVFHFIRFGGLFLIPFIYGFSYIFAFYDPFKYTDKLPIAIVTAKNINGNHDIEDNLGRIFANAAKIGAGELELDIKPEHIYLDEQDFHNKNKINQIDNKYNASIFLNPLTPDQKNKLKDIVNDLTGSGFNKLNAISDLRAFINSFDENNPIVEVRNNYKKNYLIGFGVDIGQYMTGGATFMTDLLIKAMQDDALLKSLGVKQSEIHDIKANAKKLENSQITSIHAINIYSQMGGEHAKYGYGLAPFFICVAMWIGGMVMTFSVHKKIYDKSISPTKRYVAKWLVITMGTIVQASVLMISLYLIGFKHLGITHWGSMFAFAIIIGMVFSSIIQAIRFLVPNRNLGIFLIIILLVLQMASGGGLYPIETQSKFYQVINKILPMGHAITVLRETAFDTNWSHLMIEFGYLSLYLFVIPFAIWANHFQTITFYMRNDWELLSNMKAHKHVGRFESD